jgi:CBS domain-containing protein
MLIEHILATKGRDVITVRSDASVADAVAVLRRHGIGAVVVSDDDGATASGILSERDVVHAVADDGAAGLARTVASLMTADVVTCEPSATVVQLMELMTTRRIRHLPVLDAGGRLTGLVSIGDIVKSRVGELAEEAQTLHDYVTSGR